MRLIPLTTALFGLPAASLLAQSQFTIDPTLHITGVAGVTSAAEMSDLGAHGHDPNNDAALQSAELGLNLRTEFGLSGFVTGALFTDSETVSTELEEAFLKYDALPGGFEIRAGRYLNRIGLQNNKHLHSWNYINANLFTGSVLGEDGLITTGGELTWFKELDSTFVAVSAAYGKVVPHSEEDHGGGHEHEDSNESAYFSEHVVTARALFGYNQSDFHQHRLGLNFATGKNAYDGDHDTTLASVDYVYSWKENGLEGGGRGFSVGTEFWWRDVEWQHEDVPTTNGSSDHWGWMAFAQYDFSDKWNVGLRYESLKGGLAGAEAVGAPPEDEYAFNIEDRDRISLAVTRNIELGEQLDAHLRLQYSHDRLPEGNEDSLWFQVAINFGQDEVR